MRISDRSSDVCSSDLAALVAAPFSFARPGICSYYVPTNESGEWNMIGYVTLGTDDLARAAAFYDAIAAELETPRMMEYESFIAWGKPDGGAGIGLTKPFRAEERVVGKECVSMFESRGTPYH